MVGFVKLEANSLADMCTHIRHTLDCAKQFGKMSAIEWSNNVAQRKQLLSAKLSAHSSSPVVSGRYL